MPEQSNFEFAQSVLAVLDGPLASFSEAIRADKEANQGKAPLAEEWQRIRSEMSAGLLRLASSYDFELAAYAGLNRAIGACVIFLGDEKIKKFDMAGAACAAALDVFDKIKAWNKARGVTLDSQKESHALRTQAINTADMQSPYAYAGQEEMKALYDRVRGLLSAPMRDATREINDRHGASELGYGDPSIGGPRVPEWAKHHWKYYEGWRHNIIKKLDFVRTDLFANDIAAFTPQPVRLMWALAKIEGTKRAVARLGIRDELKPQTAAALDAAFDNSCREIENYFEARFPQFRAFLRVGEPALGG